MPTDRLSYLKGQERDRLQSGSTRASTLEKRADEAREAFDASEYARDVAQAQFSTFREDLAEDVESFRGNQVSRGRLDTGYGFEDEDRLVRDSYENLNTQLVQNAFQAARLDLTNVAGIQGAAEGARERDLDLLVGATDRAQADENQRQRKKRRRFGLLGGLAGAAVGSFVPGVGTVAGAKLGSAIGGEVG